LLFVFLLNAPLVDSAIGEHFSVLAVSYFSHSMVQRFLFSLVSLCNANPF
jgi:hypothetical protein